MLACDENCYLSALNIFSTRFDVELFFKRDCYGFNNEFTRFDIEFFKRDCYGFDNEFRNSARNDADNNDDNCHLLRRRNHPIRDNRSSTQKTIQN